MSSPKKKAAGKGHKAIAGASRGGMHDTVEIIVRAVIAEKGLLTKKGTETAINKATADMKSHILALEAKVISLESSVNSLRIHVDDSVQRIHQEIDEVPKRCLAIINKVGKKQKEDIDAIKAESNKKMENIEGEASKLAKELAKLCESFESL
jgi:predicted  nucleic acid-binding Zn-ribbon protein